MESNIIDQFNLPSYVKGKTFAEASKAIDRKFKDREDKYSEQTKQELLSRLAEAQEYIKMQNEAIQANSTQVPDMMGGDIPAGMEEFAGGGMMDSQYRTYEPMQNETAEATKDAVGNAIPWAGLFRGIEKMGVNMASQQSEKNGTIASSLFDPIGGAAKVGNHEEIDNKFTNTVASVFLPGYGGMLLDKANEKREAKVNNANAVIHSNQFKNEFKNGGKMNSYDGGGLEDIFGITPKAQADLNLGATMNTFNNSLNQVYNQPSFTMASPKSERSAAGLAASRGADWLKSNIGNLMTYAPILGNAIELSKLKEPVTDRGTRLDNKYNKQLFDVNSLINQVNQNDVKSALTEASGGDLGALRSNTLAANLNKSKAISDALIKGNGINRDENRFEFQTDMQRDQINANLEDRYVERKARDKGAYETTKGNLKRAMYEDIGKVGQDIVNKKLVREMFGYTWSGEYYINKDGDKKSKEEMLELVNKTNNNMFGGYTMKK